MPGLQCFKKIQSLLKSPDHRAAFSPLSSTTLGKHVAHFELLNYDAAEVEREHARHKRSAPKDDHKVSVDFASHGRRFRLDLERDYEAFREDSNLKIHRMCNTYL